MCLCIWFSHTSVHMFAGNACDRRSRKPPGRPTLFGGFSVQPWQEASGSGSQHTVICCRIFHSTILKKQFHKWMSCEIFFFCVFVLLFVLTPAGSGWVPSLYAAVQFGPGLHGAAAPSLAQHVHHCGSSHEPRVGQEWRGQGRLRHTAGAAEQLLSDHSTWLPWNKVV